MKHPKLKPQEVLAHLIAEIGAMSEGWGVDILISAIEYLDSRTPQEYLEKRAYTIGGVKMVHSSVHMWAHGHPRSLPIPQHVKATDSTIN